MIVILNSFPGNSHTPVSLLSVSGDLFYCFDWAVLVSLCSL